ncbi:MAG TPA: hypothetical protein ENI81_05805 [Phycisphaerales bacterium]|nr:hypothetical protein [Phycisphaerales bacterium]
MLLRAHYEPGCAILRIARNEVKRNPLARMVVLIGPSASLGMTEWGIGMTQRGVGMTEATGGQWPPYQGTSIINRES